MQDTKEKKVAKPPLLKNVRPSDKQERINAIKKAIAQGRYEINPDRIAEKIVALEEDFVE